MAVYGYQRISTARQLADLQRVEILKFADARKLRVDEWVEETVSGTRSYRDRKLGKLVERLQAGDILIVSEISRLGRSLLEVMELLHRMMQAEVLVYTVKENFVLGDNVSSKVLAFAFSLSAEIERNLISSRTRESLAQLKASGKVLGRPKGSLSGSKLDPHAEEIRGLLAKKVSKASIARIFNCSPGTLYAFLKRRRISQPAEA